MKVAIIGPGALGCLLAAKFSLAGEEVWLVDYRPERAQLLNRRGLVLHTPGGTAVPVQVKAGGAGEAGAADLTILTVKAHQTGAAVQDLPVLMDAGGLALTLQNGLGNLEEMARVAGTARLVGGASILGATKLGEGEVLLAGLGPTYVGSPANSRVSASEVEAVAALFRKAGLPCEVRGDIEAVLWEKLLVNVGINPLTALLRVKNGVLPEIPPAWELAVAAAAETLAVARSQRHRTACGPGNPPQRSLHRHRGQPLVHAPGCAERPPYRDRGLKRPGDLPRRKLCHPHPGEPLPHPTHPGPGGGSELWWGRGLRASGPLPPPPRPLPQSL